MTDMPCMKIQCFSASLTQAGCWTTKDLAEWVKRQQGGGLPVQSVDPRGRKSLAWDCPTGGFPYEYVQLSHIKKASYISCVADVPFTSYITGPSSGSCVITTGKQGNVLTLKQCLHMSDMDCYSAPRWNGATRG